MDRNYDAKLIEKQARAYWKKINLFQKINEERKEGEEYFLLDGPPYANNVPHVGHVRNTIYKDFYIRKAILEGKNVLFQPGFDTHGLPIENIVEKKLGIQSKQEIIEMGIDKFAKKCKEYATENLDLWMETYEKLGSMYAWKKPYITYENEYLESVWWGFKKIWDKGMVYEGKKPVHWCPSCQTALAGYEVTDSYKNVSDPEVIVKFPLSNEKDTYVLSYTTTPWTLPSNTVLVVREDGDYVKVQVEKDKLILSKDRLQLLEDMDKSYMVLEEFKGKKLIGKSYDALLNVPNQKELSHNPKAQKIVASIEMLKERIASKTAEKKGLKNTDIHEHFVSTKEGTGIVHTAPGHGKTDNLLGKHYDLPELSPLNDKCEFTDDAGKYQGMFVKDADNLIMKDLEKQNLLFYKGKVNHSYPLCWRCKNRLIFRLSNQWFIKIDSVKEQMLTNNEKVNWQPDFAGERFHNWVANAEDWNFSRQRFWGVPIPVWKSESGKYKVIGSKEELEKELGKKLPSDYDLHNISQLTLTTKEGEKMRCIGDIFDVWYDSGSAPFASMHYPFENKKRFEKHYPVNRINEAQDQVRGWFYSLMFINTALFKDAPYKNVSMPGWVLDAKGDKMSKSVGNFIPAHKAATEFGADNVRFYYCWDIDPGSQMKFDPNTVTSEINRFHNILWNLKNLLKSEHTAYESKHGKLKLNKNPKTLQIEDEWILSRFASTIQSTRVHADEFELQHVGRKIYGFVVEDLSRTYIQLVRDRLQEDNKPLQVLYHVLNTLVTEIAAISPHISEIVYQDLKELTKESSQPESVHLTKYADKLMSKQIQSYVNEELEENFAILQTVITATLASRDRAEVSMRYPVKKVYLDVSEKAEKAIKQLSEVFLYAVNAKSYVFEKPKYNVVISPNYKEIGKEHGQDTQKVAKLIKENTDALKEIEETKIKGYKVHNDMLDLTVEPAKDFEIDNFKHGIVGIKKTLSKEMLSEGLAREVIRRIQVLRKELNLDKIQKVDVRISTDKDLQKVIKEHKDEILESTGSKSLKLVEKTKHFDNFVVKTIHEHEIKLSISLV